MAEPVKPKLPDSEPRRARSSRHRYRQFRENYRKGKLDYPDDPKVHPPAATPADPAAVVGAKRKLLLSGERRAYLRNYLHWLWPHRSSISVVFALGIIAAGMEMLAPLFMRFIIDRVLLNDALDMPSRLTRLQTAGGIFLGVILLSKLVGVFKNYRQRIVNVSVMLALRRSLFQRLLHLPLAKLWDIKTGGILSRLTGDIDATTGLLQMAVMLPSIAVVRLIIAVVVLVSLNWRLALIALAVIAGSFLMSLTFARRVRPIYRSLRNDVEQIDGRVGEAFSGVRVVRAFGRELRELSEYMYGRHTVLRKELFAYRRDLVIWTSWGLLLGIVNVVIVWYGGYLNILGRASIGDIMAFQWYTFLLLSPVQQLVDSFSELQRSLAAMERVFEVLGMEQDKPDRPCAVDAPPVVEEIRFEDVEFEYRQGLPVVRDFSVAVRGGTVVALVGRSGAGKTTVTDLVARFHEPTKGRILLNGVDIRDLRLHSYRRLLAIVHQDVFLFDGSARDNIAYGRVDATDADIEDAARRANAHEFIEKLPNGYNTLVGERGVKLSGGQQQRLAIARAFLAAPQILILDEATSNLDTESERLIQGAMATLLSGRTTFMIAHRLSTIRRANLILVMEDGLIIERGTHESLMAARGTYCEMVQRQLQVTAQGAEESM